MIEINKLSRTSVDEIKSLLQAEGGNTFEIAFPKSTQLYFSSSEEIAEDYLLGAFVGQQLSAIATKFEYLYISPSEHASFEYTVTCNNIDLLANKILFFISYFDYDTDEEYEDFMNAVYDFEDKIDSIEIACPDMLEDYQEYSKESVDDDE